jgi:hypothetical protein
MSRPRVTQHEIDCQIVRNFLDITAGKTERVRESFARIELRARRTSVSGRDYIMHVRETDGYLRVYCGRLIAKVNSVKLTDARADIDSEQWCQRCVARIKKEKTL